MIPLLASTAVIICGYIALTLAGDYADHVRSTNPRFGRIGHRLAVGMGLENRKVR